MSKRKAKQKEEKGFDPSTTKEEFAEDSPEALEAAEKFREEQAAHMADLDEYRSEPEPDKEPVKTPEDKPAEPEPEGEPEAEEKSGEKEAKAEEKPAAEEEPEPPAEHSAEGESPYVEPEFIPGDRFDGYTVEVITEKGSKRVPVTNLVTTYTKYGELQRKHLDAKPIFDLAEKAGVPISQVYPLLEIGIQTYMKQQGIVDGTTPPVIATAPPSHVSPPQPPGSYDGPFNDAEQDAYYKEVDPDLHATMHRMYQMARSAGGGGEIAALRQEIAALKQARTAPPDPGAEQMKYEEATKRFDDIVLKWSGDHTDYFSQPNIGPARLNGFKNFIYNEHKNSGLKLKDLTPKFLQAEFARFDPSYNYEYLTKLAQKKAAEAKSDSGMFAESTGVRSKADPLDEQQKHMADI